MAPTAAARPAATAAPQQPAPHARDEDAASSNLGPSGRVVTVDTASALEVPAPEPARVARMAAALLRADQPAADGEDEDAVADAVAARVAQPRALPSRAAGGGIGVVVVAPPAATRSAPPLPTAVEARDGAAAAIAALVAQLQREQARIVELGALLASRERAQGAASDELAEAMASSAARVARLASGLHALRQLDASHAASRA